MTRKRKLALNTIIGLLKQLVVLICGFILPRYMLAVYGSAVNGLVSSITHFLSFISLLDLGVGSVILANLYGPLAKNDLQNVSKICKSSVRFFRRLAYIFLIYIAVLAFVFPVAINNEFAPYFTVSLIIIISISSFAQYMFGMTYQLLLTADQKAYVQLSFQIGTIVLNTVLSIILMKMGASVHLVKLMTSAVFVIRPIGQSIYVNKHYGLDKNVELNGEPIKQKWNGFSQHLASVICQNIDVVVLTLFSSLKNVSIYTVYFMITNGVTQVIMTSATGLESLFGNMIAKNENDDLREFFSQIEWVIHFIVTIIFTVAAIMIVPFVRIYTRGIQDANYIMPMFGLLLVIAYSVQCLRIPYFGLIKAAGHFKQTQNGAYISAGLNVIITVLVVFKYGLIGAAMGTLIAMFYHTCYFAWYLQFNILKRRLYYFLKLIMTDIIIGVLSIMLSRRIDISPTGYLQWIYFSIVVSISVLLVSVIVNLLISKRQVQKMFSLFRRKTKLKSNNSNMN